MNAELKLDVYCGENCNKAEPQWDTYCDGDMDGDISNDPIIMSPLHFPPGTKVLVMVPECPDCHLPRMSSGGQNECGETIVTHESKCECGFDWHLWEQNEYS